MVAPMSSPLLALVASATVATAGAVAAAVIVGHPSILPQCMDSPTPVLGVSPSARARECTRQYCARPEYQAKVTAYSMSRPQSEGANAEALTCITRAEQ